MLIFFGFDLYFDQRHLFFMANKDKDALTKVYMCSSVCVWFAIFDKDICFLSRIYVDNLLYFLLLTRML